MRLLLVITTIFIASAVPALAQCGDGECGVGLYGTGGTASDGKAQGWHLEQPATPFPGETYTNVGNINAGRVSVSNEGSNAGTTRGGVSSGHATGIFGTFSGHN